MTPSPGQLRGSAAFYVGVLAVGVVLERYANYLWYAQPVFKGQPANILLAFAAVAVAFAFWIRLERRPRAAGWLAAFLIAMSAAWVVQLVIFKVHGDAFNYTAFLYVPILAMLALKPPHAAEAWTAVLAFAWATAAVLVLTRILEMVSVLDIRHQNPNVITFDIERYWLPLNEYLGIDGRWPGPFGHNGDTAMMGALLIVIAVARWTPASWVFIPVGVFTLLVTSGRASMGATAAGLVVIGMFNASGPLARMQRRFRLTGGAAILALGVYAMFSGKAGVTGRDQIWPGFIDLWQSSPWIGVGGSGISVSGGITQQFGHAHSLYLDELARHGLLGLIVQFGALLVGLVITGLAAGRGAPGPLAVLVAYFVTGVTEPRNDWIHPSATGFLVILMVVTSAAELKQSRDSGSDPEQRADGLALEPIT